MCSRTARSWLTSPTASLCNTVIQPWYEESVPPATYALRAHRAMSSRLVAASAWACASCFTWVRSASVAAC